MDINHSSTQGVKKKVKSNKIIDITAKIITNNCPKEVSCPNSDGIVPVN